MRSAKSALSVRRIFWENGTKGGKVAAEALLWAVRMLFQDRAERRVPLFLLSSHFPRKYGGQAGHLLLAG
jgi:hypothetical protein